MTVYPVNSYNFSEVTESDRQITVTNNLGRTILDYEIVNLGGMVGEVKQYGGIANGASGKINIEDNRTIRTAQIEVTDTFVVGQLIYFVSGGAGAAGKLRSTPVAGSVLFGKCLAFGGTGGAHTYIEARPIDQSVGMNPGSAVKVAEIIVPTGSHAAGAPVVSTVIPVGSKIIDVVARTTAANAGGTVTISDGTNAITNAIIMAVLHVQTAATTIDSTYSTVIAAGIKLTANATGDAGRVYVYYI